MDNVGYVDKVLYIIALLEYEYNKQYVTVLMQKGSIKKKSETEFSLACSFEDHAASWGDFAFQKPIRHRNIGRLPKHDLPVFLAIIGDLRFLRGIRNVECDDKRFPVEGA